MAYIFEPPPAYWNADLLEETLLTIPMRNSQEEVVELDLNNLPDCDAVLEILRNEEPPIKIWNRIALHYHVRGKTDVFSAILEEGREHASSKEETSVDEAFCLDLLANYYALLAADSHVDRERRKELNAKALALYGGVDKLLYGGISSRYHLVGRAYFSLLDPLKTDQAVAQFDLILTGAPTDVLAGQGRGIVAFQQGDYKKALGCFKKILRDHPGCSADIRMAIGHCLFKLGHLEKAKQAYHRAIQLDPDCFGAHMGLASILMNEDGSSSTQQAMGHVAHVYKREKATGRMNPGNLNMLANHYFYKSKPDLSMSLAKLAIQCSFNEANKAESAYYVGRCYHVRGDYEQAFYHYHQSTQFAKQNYVLPWFGLGQIYIDKKDYPNAVHSFEKVLVVHPDNIDTLRILSLLYSMVDVKDKKALAREYLKKVTELSPDDVDSHIKFAELQEAVDPASALNSYLRVIQIFSERSSALNETPPEILNNVSVLYFNLGQIEKSLHFLELARKRTEEIMPTNEVHYKAILMTMTYNRGRLMEELGSTEEAEDCYRSIEGDEPNYLDCYLRYGCIARDKGDILKASDWFTEAAYANPEHPDSHLLLGNLHMTKGEYGPAQKEYEKVLENKDTKADTYALLSLANISLERLHRNLPDVERKRYAEKAFMLYKQVLKLDPTNVYAVNGMGAVLAETGQMEEAKEMFSAARESSADILDLWLNMGHSCCAHRQYVTAVKMYEHALKHFKDAALDPTVFLYLARAQYSRGYLKGARKTLQLALHIAPENQALRYNLAVVIKRMALVTFSDAKKDTSSTLVHGAVEDLKAVERIFEFLSTDGDQSVMDSGRVQLEMKKCSDLILFNASKLADVDDSDLRERNRLVNFEESISRKKLHLEEGQPVEEPRRMQREELVKKRQQVIQKTLKRKKEKIVCLEAGEDLKSARKRPRKAADMENDGFIDDEGNFAGGERKRARGEGGDRKGRKAARRLRREERRAQGLPLSSEDENVEPDRTPPRRRNPEPEYDRKGRKFKPVAHISHTDSSVSSDSDSVEKCVGQKSSVSEDESCANAIGRKTLASSDGEADGGKLPVKKKKSLATSEDDDDDEGEPEKKPKRNSTDSDEGGCDGQPPRTKKTNWKKAHSDECEHDSYKRAAASSSAKDAVNSAAMDVNSVELGRVRIGSV